MSQIIIDRSVVEQAIEAFEDYAKQYPHMQKGYMLDAAEALRAALDQPQVEQEPFTVLVRKRSWLDNQWEAAPRGFPDYGKLWADERINVYTHPQNLSCKSTQARLATLWGYEKPQPPRQPLTDEELNLIASRWHLHLLEGQDKQDLFEFARAIESYSASAKLTQLTNEQISAIVANHCLNVGDWSKNGASVARAIERAHGIGGEA